ncbi:hypothetical protein [Nonomuraea guangzhouensis]|uniref:Uncharacterized protein n=1 Tax=Nonomuraea guangzhouensis TaxID=1291555 RepID=A0ABW4FZ88_9ACTN|nr:hypothetical protein [Nonomuraea guangzhouensis]
MIALPGYGRHGSAPSSDRTYQPAFDYDGDSCGLALGGLKDASFNGELAKAKPAGIPFDSYAGYAIM